MSLDKPQEILKEVRLFAEKSLRPKVYEIDKKGGIPKQIIYEMAEKGYLAAPLPRKTGGLGLDPIHYGLFTEIIARECASVRAMLTVHSSLVGETIMRWGSSEQKERLIPLISHAKKLGAFALSEPKVGSDAGSVQTAYKVIGSEYVINGVKKWITLGAIADLFVVIARNKDLVTAFIVDKKSKGIKVKPTKGLSANRGAYTAEIEFENVRVTKDDILGQEGNGFSFIVNTALDNGRYSVAWGGLGLAYAAFEAMLDYANERHQYRKRIFDFQLIQQMIGDGAVELEAGKALCLETGRMRLEKEYESIGQTIKAKYFTSKIANRIASDAVQIHGANGFSDQFPVERLLREAKLLEVIEGTSQVLVQMIAKNELTRLSLARS